MNHSVTIDDQPAIQQNVGLAFFVGFNHISNNPVAS